MIVYMILNEATDMVYVGKTTLSIDERWLGHVENSKSDIDNRFARAIKEWGTDVWTRVVLQFCHTEEELSVAEGNWIEYTSALDPNIGYNSMYVRSALDRVSQGLMKLNSRKPREFFVECGKKGATFAKKREQMTPEERERFKAWGRQGAEAARSKRLLKSL